jgi:hypothetical protein
VVNDHVMARAAHRVTRGWTRPCWDAAMRIRTRGGWDASLQAGIGKGMTTGDVMKKPMGQSYSTENPPRLLTIKQVAERLTVSVGCLRAWRIRGDGPA